MRFARRAANLAIPGVLATWAVAPLLISSVAVAAAVFFIGSVWPGSTTVQTVDNPNQFGGNLSGLVYEGTGTSTPGVIWTVRNGPGAMFRLLWTGSVWVPDPNNAWSVGKSLRFPDGTGDVDAEGVTFASFDSTEMFVASERDNSAPGTSRNSILSYNATAPGSVLSATNEWNLTVDLPETAGNSGIESIAWAPDATLVANGFFDSAAGHIYAPSEYPNHGTGLFFVGLEPTGDIYVYALNQTNSTYSRLALFASGLTNVMSLEFDPKLAHLWAGCDNNCQGAMSVLEIDAAGSFAVAASYDPPTGLPDSNNEGFVVTPMSECVDGSRPVFWADDNELDGHALRRGGLDCSVVVQLCNGLQVTVDIAAGELPTELDDVIRGTTQPDLIDALGGNDSVCGLGGDDTLTGSAGIDTMFGGDGDDSLYGGAGNDFLHGENGNDGMRGGGGDDLLDGGPGLDGLI